MHAFRDRRMGLVLHWSSCYMLAALQCVAFVVCNYFSKINNKEKNQEEYIVLFVLRSFS